MNHGISVLNTGNTTSLFHVITFTLCISFDLVFRACLGANIQLFHFKR